MKPSNQLPLSIMSRAVLTSSIGRFLRTHRQGEKLLHEFMAASPRDRTEAQVEQERTQPNEARRAAEQRARASLTAQRLAGLPLIDKALLLSQSTSD